MDDELDLLDGEPINESPYSEPSNDYGGPPIENNIVETTIETQQNENNSNDLLDNLLARVGIKDKNNILYEDSEEPIKWDDIDLEEQINILTQNNNSSNTDLNNQEIQIINAIRNSRMNPNDFINYQIRQGIQKYLDENQSAYTPTYQVDDIEDDVLFASDIISKVGEENITEEELKEILENAKSNPTLYKKQVDAIRAEYKRNEQAQIQEQQTYQQQQQVEQYNQFAESVENSIRGFQNVSGMDLEMSEDEMENLYNLLVGFDENGVREFSKILNNPQTLVQMGWFALYGQEALNEMNESFNKYLKAEKEKSYKKGLEDAAKPSSLYINNKKTKFSSGEDALDLI